MIAKNEELRAELETLTGHFYVLAVQYFEGIKGRDIPKWEDELQGCMDRYEEIRDKWIYK